MKWRPGNGIGNGHDRLFGPGFGGILRSLFDRMPWSESATREESLIVPAPAGRSIRVHNANGKTRIVGEDRDDIELRIEKSVRADCSDVATKLLDSIRVQSSEGAEILEIEVQIPRRCSRHAVAHIELRVPRDTRVSTRSSNGKICLEGIDRDVRAYSSNGSISICEVNGNVDVMTANAKVACRCTHGHLRARSSNGKIELGGHRGSVEASTSNGVICCSLESVGEVGVSLTTSNGRIVLDLPETLDADIDMRVENGLIRNDLDLEQQTGDESGWIRGRLGKGGCPIKLRTSNGTISVR